MSNLCKLIFDELMEYKDILGNEFISDLDILHMENKVVKKVTSSSNRFLLDVYCNHGYNYTIYHSLLEKCNINNNYLFKHSCIICLENINIGDDIYNLKCGTKEQPHIYHKMCFEKWNKQSCPYCRQVII